MRLLRFLLYKISTMLFSQALYLTKSLTYKKDALKKLPLSADYIRDSTLELCAEQILSKKIVGNVAELGVYKGDFAKKINLIFMDKKLYLFDTFEGFATKDINIEKEKMFSDGSQNFSDTSIELVKNKMKYPENCIFKKGYFPETASDIFDKYCFVSIDTDLYEPIYQGLEFFYPKLECGGYIFIHDFNNSSYSGAKQAVIDFCTKYNIGYVPISDVGGTAIITK
ncbi:MAG: methyltransferase [Bacteroidetes bacterium]|nr:MAG: methyltransferase [Bacteroidota bacterium]